MLTLLAKPTSAGAQVGRYRIIKPWDESRACYVAEEPISQVAVIARTLTLDSSMRSAFLESLRAIGDLEHEHIVPIIESGDSDDGCYVICDSLKGETLQARLNREHRLPLNEAIRIACEIASALKAIHTLGLIHRDVCPANIWLDLSGRAQLTGFAPEPGDDSLLDRLDGPGTPGYLSPEQAAGEAVTASADLFSLGCILYQMATGVQPFQGQNSAALFRAVIFDHPQSARESNPEISVTLDNLLTRLLAKMASDRPATAAEVQSQLMGMIEANAIQPLLQPVVSAASNYPASKRILNTLAQTRNLEPEVTVPTVSRLDVIMAPPPPQPTRRTWLPDLVAGLLLVMGAAGLYLWWKASNETPPQAPAVKQEQGKR